MEKIYSNIDPHVLLHLIVRKEDFIPGRRDLISDENFLQCSILNLPARHTFKAHKHIWKQSNRKMITQESWVVLSGSVQCIFYDLDNSRIAEPVLYAGDASFTLQGGHTYVILSDNTRVLEFKVGPYEGQGRDKIFI